MCQARNPRAMSGGRSDAFGLDADVTGSSSGPVQMASQCFSCGTRGQASAPGRAGAGREGSRERGGGRNQPPARPPPCLRRPQRAREC